MKNAIPRPKDLVKAPDPAESTWRCNGIKTIDQLKQWILIKCGAPTQTVELTDEQLDVCIGDALRTYSKFAYRPEKYLVLNLKYYEPGKGIDLSEFKVMSVKSIALPRDNVMGLYGDTFFSPYAFFGQGSNFPFFNGQNGMSGNWVGSWVTFHNITEFWNLTKEMCGNNPDFVYDKNTQRLRLMPEPHGGAIGKCILATCNCEPPLEDYLSDEFFTQLCLAESKMLLGTVRKKFQNVSLPGGGTLDTSVYDEGKELKDRLMEEIIKCESRGSFFIAN